MYCIHFFAAVLKNGSAMWLLGCSGWFLTFPHQKSPPPNICMGIWLRFLLLLLILFFTLVKYRTGTWHYPSIVHWMRANLNASLLSILDERGLSWLNYWRSPAYVTKKMSDVLLDDQVLTFWWNITRSNYCEKIKSSLKYTWMNQSQKDLKHAFTK